MFNSSFQFQKKGSYLSVIFAGLLTVAALLAGPSLARADAGFSGKVTDLSLAPLAGVQVQLLDVTGNQAALPVTTLADGSYTYGGFPAGSYKLEFLIQDPNSNLPTLYYNNKLYLADADVLTLSDGVVVPGINAIIASWGEIGGKVTSASGTGIAGISVTVCDLSGVALPNVSAVTTKSDGSYVVGGIAPATGAYKVKFGGNSQYAGQWYSNAATSATAIPVSVAAFQTTSVSQVLPAASITGKITDASGAAVPNIQIYLYDPVQNVPVLTIPGTVNQADGTYTISGVPNGSYKVGFLTGLNPSFQKQYYNGKSAVTSADVLAYSGTTLTGINAVLAGAPIMRTFIVPAFSKSLTATGLVLSATDAVNAVAGYLLTESATPPSANAAGWSASAPTSYTFDSAGIKTLYAWAKGSTGLVSASLSKTLPVDPTPPVLAISALHDTAATTDAVLNVTGSATVSLSTIASLTVNGAAAVISPADGSFSYPVVLNAGANTLTLTATDSTGLASTVTRNVTLNSALPPFTITAPADNSTLQASFLAVTGTADATATVSVTANGGSAQSVDRSGAAFTSTVNLTAGLNTIEVSVTDLASGAVNTRKRTVFSNPASSLVAVTDPAQDMLITPVAGTPGSYTVQGTASNPLSALSVTVAAYGQSFTPVLAADGSFSQLLSFPAAQNYPVVVTATDANHVATTAQRNIIIAGSPTGDVNGDGVVDVGDALLALRIAVKLVPMDPKYLINGDVAPLVNGKPQPDGVIDVGDALLILRKVVQLVSWP